MDKYERISKLGEGGQGKVYKVRSKTSGRELVCKMILCVDQETVELATKEAEVMGWLKHKNIIQYEGTFLHQGKAGLYLCLIMEYCSKGDLHSKMREYKQKKESFKERHAVRYLRQVLTALEFMHKSGFCHRDIKAANILFDASGSVKVGDFGLSTLMSPLGQQTVVGTPFYFAPEIMLQRKYTTKVDIWNLGVVFLELCTLRQRPANVEVLHSEQTVLEDVFREVVRHGYSRSLATLITQMLRRRPQDRPSASDLIQQVDKIWGSDLANADDASAAREDAAAAAAAAAGGAASASATPAVAAVASAPQTPVAQPPPHRAHTPTRQTPTQAAAAAHQQQQQQTPQKQAGVQVRNATPPRRAATPTREQQKQQLQQQQQAHQQAQQQQQPQQQRGRTHTRQEVQAPAGATTPRRRDPSNSQQRHQQQQQPAGASAAAATGYPQYHARQPRASSAAGREAAAQAAAAAQQQQQATAAAAAAAATAAAAQKQQVYQQPPTTPRIQSPVQAERWTPPATSQGSQQSKPSAASNYTSGGYTTTSDQSNGLSSSGSSSTQQPQQTQPQQQTLREQHQQQPTYPQVQHLPPAVLASPRGSSGSGQRRPPVPTPKVQQQNPHAHHRRSPSPAQGRYEAPPSPGSAAAAAGGEEACQGVVQKLLGLTFSDVRTKARLLACHSRAEVITLCSSVSDTELLASALEQWLTLKVTA